MTCHRQRSTKLSTTYANVWTHAFRPMVDISLLLNLRQIPQWFDQNTEMTNKGCYCRKSVQVSDWVLNHYLVAGRGMSRSDAADPSRHCRISSAAASTWPRSVSTYTSSQLTLGGGGQLYYSTTSPSVQFAWRIPWWQPATCENHCRLRRRLDTTRLQSLVGLCWNFTSNQDERLQKMTETWTIEWLLQIGRSDVINICVLRK